ncbi:hypothetical protein ACKLNQ_17235 [Myroides odoratimimus]|uniref:hypothetical protein n=1 Tax=Myroides odoratimimus TaxID=76832 RepID=UPI0038D451B2
MNGLPIHTVSDIRSTTLLYDQSMPTLVAGKKYGWRVKATSFSGLAENSSVKNEGFSEVRSFSIRVNCGAPDLLLPRDNGRQGVRLDWQGAPSHLKYHVQYRKTGIVGAEWFDRYVLNNQTVITDLEPGYTYEFRVGATCEPEVYPASPHYTYSRPQEFTLKASDDRGESGFSCGLKGDTDITNREPITNLVVNETFYAGDFEVKILGLESTGSTTYSGVGSIYVPYLGITLAVEFKNIEINTDYQLIRGVVETVYDKDWKNVHNTNELNKKESLHEEVDFIIEKITVDEQGNPKLIGTDGQEKILEKNKDYTIVDKDGKTWTIPSGFDGEKSITEPTGEVSESGVPSPKNTTGVGKDGAVTAFSAKGVRIYFENSEDSKYAFDNASGAKSSSKYGKLYKEVKGEYLPYKAVVNGQQDVVLARVEFTGSPVELDSLYFKTSAGAAIPFKKNSDTAYELTVKGSFKYAEDQIMAVYKPKGESKYVVAGAMQLIHLNAITLPLRIVPTSSSVNTAELEQTIKEHYSRVGVTVDSKVLALYTGGSLNVSEVSKDDKKALSSYTPLEHKFIEEYFNTHEQEAAFYLFVSDKEGGQFGRMPIKNQFGFITDPRKGDRNKKEKESKYIALTSAHELGHGAFELQHPFTQYNTAPGKSNSTMDIPAATDFNQVDWKQMNMRKFSLKTWVQTKSDGALELKDGVYLGFTPNGKVVKNTSTGYFNNENNSYFITGFGDGNQKQVYTWIDKDGGYYYDESNKNKVYPESQPITGKVAIWQNSSKPECFTLYKFIDVKNYTSKDFNKIIDIIKKDDGKGWKTDTVHGADSECGKEAARVEKEGIVPTKINAKGGVEGGQETESSCKGFMYFNVMSSEDKDVIKQALIKGFNDRKSLSSEDRSLGKFNHIQIVGDKTGAPIAELELLEDRLHLLSYYRPEVYVSVVFLQKDIEAFYTVEALNKGASEIVKEAQLGKKTLLMIVPYGKTLNLKDTCVKLGYGQVNDGDVVLAGDVSIDGAQSWNKNVYKIFAQIEKPLFVHRYYRFADESILEVTFPKTQKVKGYPFIKNLEFYESNGLIKLKELDRAWSYLKGKDTGYYQEYEEKRARELEGYLSLEKTPKGLENVNLWHGISTEDLGKFREPYFDNKSLTDQLWVDSKESWTWGAKVKIGWQLNGTLLKDRHFYGFSRAKLVDDFVYGVTDVVGMIPVADIFADAFGVLYSAARGNYFETSVYSTSLAIPLAGAAYIKGGAKIGEDAAKRIGIIATKADNADGFVLRVAHVGDIKPGELQLTSVYLGPNQQLTKEFESSVLADVKNYTKKADIVESLKHNEAVKLLKGKELLSYVKESLRRSGLSDDALRRLDDSKIWTDEKLQTLNHYLSDPKKYGNLAEELNNKNLFDAVEAIIDNPIDAWDIIKQTQSDEVIRAVTERIGKSQFFKEVVGRGRTFETLVTSKIKTINPPFADLIADGFTHLDQIYLLRKGGSKNIIADDLFVKKVFDEVEEISYYRAVISDSKLTNGSPWTDNQWSELIEIFQNNKNLPFIEYEVRTSSEILSLKNNVPTDFKTSTKIRIYREDVYKIVSDEAGNIKIPPIKMNDINFKK